MMLCEAVMRILLFAFYILSTTIASSLSNETVPPFCNICKCEKTSNKNNLKLTCNDWRIKKHFFDDSYWIDNKNNEFYQYETLIIQNTTLAVLHKQIPTSTLVLLDLSRNSLHDIQENVFSKLQKLVTLILSFNNIKTFHPKALNGLYVENNYKPLRALKNLYLDNNRLTFLDSDIFAYTTRIEVLSLAHNPIKKFDVGTISAITSLKHLKILDLSNTRLSSLPDHFMKYMSKKLNILNLNGNFFKSVPRTFAFSHNLTTLYFSENPVEYLNAITGFPKITSLKILHMTNMEYLMEIKPRALSRLENLEELYLFNNSRLKTIEEEASDIDPPIRKLFLQNNNLERINIHFPFINWMTIEELDLTNNPWVCDCINEWIINGVIPKYLEIDENKAKSLRCSAPPEMIQYRLWDIYQKKISLCVKDDNLNIISTFFAATAASILLYLYVKSIGYF